MTSGMKVVGRHKSLTNWMRSLGHQYNPEHLYPHQDSQTETFKGLSEQIDVQPERATFTNRVIPKI
jgi:hypothetical protein